MYPHANAAMYCDPHSVVLHCKCEVLITEIVATIPSPTCILRWDHNIDIFDPINVQVHVCTAYICIYTVHVHKFYVACYIFLILWQVNHKFIDYRNTPDTLHHIPSRPMATQLLLFHFCFILMTQAETKARNGTNLTAGASCLLGYPAMRMLVFTIFIL